MKKITFFILFGILFHLTNFAQIAVGEQDGTTSSIPIYGLYEYSYSQQIISQNEIGAQGDITSISFYYSSGTTSLSTEWTIYLGHTQETSFDSNTDWIDISDLTEVFSGTVSYPSSENFMEIVFDVPFDYNNTDNLVIAVTETEPGWGGTINFGKTQTVSGSNKGIFFRSDTVVPDPASPPTATGRTDYVNNIILGGILPSCPAPANLRVTDVGSTTADIAWDELGTATSWNVEYGESGFARGTGTTENGLTSTNLTIPITIGTDYDVYVQSDCGNELSSWAFLPLSTTYCEPSSTSSIDYLSEVSTSGAVTDINYTASSMPAGGYSDQTAMSFRAYETLTFEMSTRYVGGVNGVNVWVDWNQNFNFEESEKIVSITNSDALKTFSITIPAGTPEGTYRMRVRGQYGSSANPPACGSVTWGSAVDFNLTIVEPPTCLAPSDLTVSNVTETTLDLGWTENGTATQWDIEYGPHGFTQGSGTMVNGVTSNPHTLNINAGEEYNFYVRSVCSPTDSSFWTGPYVYRYCDVSSQYGEFLSLVESEDAVTDIEYTATTQPPGAYADETDQILRTFEGQEFDIITTYSYNGDNGVNIWVDWDRDMNFDSSEMISSIRNSNTTKTHSITIPSGVAEGEYRMRVRGQWNGSPPPCGEVNYGSTVDFTLFIGIPPTCPSPTDLVVESVSSDSAEISWTENGTATEWEVVYGESGFDPETEGDVQTVTNTPETTLTNLDSNTVYDFYVRAICAQGDDSYLSRKQSFLTACVPETIPFFEGFENGYTNGEDLDGCWSQTSITGAQTWTANNSETTYNRSPRTGNWNVYLRYSNASWMFYPLVLEANTAYELEFYARQDATSGATVKAAFGDADSPAAMTTTIIETTDITSGSYQRVRGYFTPPTSGVYYIGILGELTVTPWYLSIDDINVTEAPGCLPPNNLTISNVTETTADLSWNILNGEDEWEVIYGEAGFNPATSGTTVMVNNDPETTLTNLESDTGYDVYVRAICGVGDESELSEVKYFFTGFCDYTSSSTDYYISDFFTEGAVVDINNRDSGRSPGGYGNFTHMQLVTYPTDDFDFEAEFNGTGTYGFNMWIDFNGDLEFDESEKVYGSGAYVSSVSGNIVIPANVQPGTYRMRIVADWLNTNPSPCGTSSYGEAEDYTVVITDLPTCLPPTDVTIEMVSVDSVEISWIPRTSEDTWKVIYGESGFDINSEGTEVIVNTPNVLIEGLENSTKYDVYVIAVCDGGDESFPAGPMSFWTLCANTTTPYLMDFETADVPNLPNCTDGENLGSGNMWETLDYNSNGFEGQVLVYRYASSPANAWFYTQGIELSQGVEYVISYKFGNVAIGFTEKMKVAFGTSPIVAQMTNELADHPEINEGGLQENTVYFTVPENGVYYFGFNVYSAANQFNLYLDDILIDSLLNSNDPDSVNITYFPNPVEDQLTITGTSEIKNVSVYSVLGQKVLENNSRDLTINLNMSGLSSGTYFVKAETVDGNHTFKVIKE